MNLEITPPLSVEEYMSTFRQVAGITDAGLNYLATKDESERKHGLKRAAEGVEFISSMRGDTGIFDKAKPDGIAQFRSEMYATENFLRDKLLKLRYIYHQR